MNEYLPEENAALTRSRAKYRLTIRGGRYGHSGLPKMIMCINFRVTLDERLMYSDLQGNLNVIDLQPGDYFEVKVMG